MPTSKTQHRPTSNCNRAPVVVVVAVVVVAPSSFVVVVSAQTGVVTVGMAVRISTDVVLVLAPAV